MLSPVFWLSVIAVFLGVKWIADGLGSLVQVEFRRKRRQVSRLELADLSAREFDAPLDKAA